MAVTLNDTPAAVAVLTPAATTDLDQTMTITAGTNLALVAHVVFGTHTPGTVTVTWDPTGANQALTQITTRTTSILDKGRVELWGLVNPTAGASKILRLHASNSATKQLQGVAWNGVDQTGGATSFPNSTTGQGTSITPTITITSAAGNKTMAGAAYADDNLAAGGTPQTSDYIDNTPADFSGAGSRETASSTPVTHNWAGTVSTSHWATVGTDIAASGAGGWGPLVGLKNNRLVGVV